MLIHCRELRRTVRFTLAPTSIRSLGLLCGWLRLATTSASAAELSAAASVAPNSGASIVEAVLVHVPEVFLESAMNRFAPDSPGRGAMGYQMLFRATATAQVSDTRGVLYRSKLFRRRLLDYR